ncbi:MAG: WD40 repeat domain-containing protein [Planctomycetes bacterium]|nr:WD40 repeat domain-containing protein [Planctomycetota bacterium]
MKRPAWSLLLLGLILLVGGIGGVVVVQHLADPNDAHGNGGSSANLAADLEPSSLCSSDSDDQQPITADDGQHAHPDSSHPAADGGKDKPDQSPGSVHTGQPTTGTPPPEGEEPPAEEPPTDPRPGRKPTKSIGGVNRRLDRFAINAGMSADGAVAFTCGPEKIQLWSPDKETSLWERKHGSKYASAAAISADGALVATTSEAGNPLLVRGADGGPVWEFEHETAISVVAFSPDAARVVVGDSTGALFSVDVETGKESRAIGAIELAAEEGLRSIQWDASAAAMYVGTNKGAFYSVSPEGDVKPLLSREDGRTWGIVLAPDGRSFLSATREQGLYLRSIPGADVLKHLPTDGPEHSMQSPKPIGRGRALVGMRDGISVAVHLWDITAFKSIASVELSFVTACAGSADGRRAITAELGGGVRFWNLDNDLFAPMDKRQVQAIYASFLPDGRRLLVGEVSGRVSIRDADTLEELDSFRTREKTVEAMLLSPMGDKLAVVDTAREPRLWTLATKESVSLGKLAEFSLMQFSTDGSRLYLGVDGKIGIFDTADGSRLGTLFDTWQIPACRVNPDGTRVAIAGYPVRLFSLPAEGEGEALDFECPPISALRFSGDGGILAVATSKGLWLWDTGRSVLSTKIDIGTYAIEFRPGRDEFMTEDGNGFIHRYKLDGELIETLGGGPEICWHVAWSPDGRRIVGVGDDQAVYLWDVD